ncbi:MAG TPA: hypothetical protein VFT22_27380 [Kofleriaceae bacterium]|nr:hypothetical protein [Kofleriaceae bacterium]
MSISRFLPVLLAVLVAGCPRPQPIVFPPLHPASAGEDSAVTPLPPTASRTTATETAEPASPASTPDPGAAATGTAAAPAATAPSSSWPDYRVPTLPMDLVLHRGTLVWADLAGAIWMMPADGSGPPKQVTEQHKDGFAARPFVAGDRVIAKCGNGLLAIEVPGGAVTHIRVTGAPDLIENVIGDGSTIFFSVFNHDQILRVPVTGGAAQQVLEAKTGVLAVDGSTLFVASYDTGDLFAVPTAGGAPRTIATKLNHATALAADGDAVYLYTEGDQRISRVELATGATRVVGEHLVNSDEVELATDAIYTVSWPNKLVRLPRAPGPAPATMSDKLFQPRGVVHDDQFVYVTSDQPPRIVRVPAR